MRLRLCSYNIHGCIGRDGRHDPHRVVDVIREVNADVIAIQEMESAPGRADDFVTLVNRGTGMRVIAGPTMNRRNVQYGNGLLTRIGVRSVRRIDLSLLDHEPRGALVVDLESHDAPLQVIATHLGLHPLERRFQIRRLLRMLTEESRDPVALLGDINEWFFWGRPLRWLHAHFGRPAAPRSFPSGFPVFALDRIWFSPQQAIGRVTAHRSRLARVASDHLPVVAEIELPLAV